MGKQYICRCWVLANESTPTLDIYLLYGKVKFVLNTLVNVNAPVVATTTWWLHFTAPVVA